MDKVAIWKSGMNGFGVYKNIWTNIVFNKDTIDAIENDKSLEKSLKDILNKYKELERDNIYCISSLMYKWAGSGSNFKLHGARMTTVKPYKHFQDVVFTMDHQKKAAESIVELLEASVSAKSNTSK